MCHISLSANTVLCVFGILTTLANPLAEGSAVSVPAPVQETALAASATTSGRSPPGQPIPAATLRGTLRAESEVPLSEMVIYLESSDPSRRFPRPAQPARISQEGARFSPALLIVPVGQTVEFPNDEKRPIEHNVFSNAPAKRFDLGLFRPGETRSVSFDKPGPVFLYCSIHRYMDGVIYVAPTPYFSRVGPGGSYQIADIPAGTWALKTWQRRKRFPELTVLLNLTPGQPFVQDLELKRKQ